MSFYGRRLLHRPNIDSTVPQRIAFAEYERCHASTRPRQPFRQIAWSTVIWVNHVYGLETSLPHL